MKYNFKLDGKKAYCRVCNGAVGWKHADRYILSSNSEGDEKEFATIV